MRDLDQILFDKVIPALAIILAIFFTGCVIYASVTAWFIS